jgi:hypothetical protein
MVREPEQPIRDLVVVRGVGIGIDVEQLDAVTELAGQSLRGSCTDRAAVGFGRRGRDPECVVAEPPRHGIQGSRQTTGSSFRIESTVTRDE